MGLAISTSWNYAHCANAEQLLQEIREAGFDSVELNFSLTQDLVSDIAKEVDKGSIRVVSVHNYCPIPDGLRREEAMPDCYNMASLDENQRKTAVHFTKRTIETAERCAAKAVVLHCGRNEIPDHTRRLTSLYQKGLGNTAAFHALKAEMQQERTVVAQQHFDQLLKSLDELAAFAQSKHIALGVENRFYYREIPSFAETRVLLEKFKGAPVFYWHDFGHARIFELLGFVRENEHLDTYARSMIGVHLHNVADCVDHQAPHKGIMDFANFNRYITKDTIKVMEAHMPQANSEDIVLSKRYLEGIFNGKV